MVETLEVGIIDSGDTTKETGDKLVRRVMLAVLCVVLRTTGREIVTRGGKKTVIKTISKVRFD